MRKTREHISSRLNIVDMTLGQLKREGKADSWTSFDFWKIFITIHDYIKNSSWKKLQEIIKN